MTIQIPDSIKSVLVTGGAGFIGGAVVRRLLTNSSVQIFNLDKIGYASDLTSIDKTLIDLGSEGEDRHHHLRVDLADKKSTKEAFSFSDPDLVLHLAAETHVDRSIDGPRDFLQSNVIGTFNLLEAALDHWQKLSGPRKDRFRFHHISTDEVFGSLDFNSKEIFSEQTPFNPRSPYSASKAASDHFVHAWNHTYGLPVILTNCSNNFGPWQFPEKLIPVVILKALAKEPIPLYGNGLNVRDWLYVEDHVDALLLAATCGQPGRNYCIGASEEKTNEQIIEMICSLLDELRPDSSPYNKLIKNVPDRPGHDLRYAINSNRIRHELGWKPRYQFSESLSITVEWYLNNLSWVKSVSKSSKYYGERIGLTRQ